MLIYEAGLKRTREISILKFYAVKVNYILQPKRQSKLSESLCFFLIWISKPAVAGFIFHGYLKAQDRQSCPYFQKVRVFFQRKRFVISGTALLETESNWVAWEKEPPAVLISRLLQYPKITSVISE